MRLQIYWRRPRRAQRLPELDNYPETPQAYYEGEFPGSKRVETLRSEFKVRHQSLPEHNVYPLTHYYPASNLETANKISFRTKLQSLPELNIYPETTQHPAYVLQKANYTKFKVKHLTAIETLDQPKNFGEYPGSGLAESFRVEFKTKLQQLPELNVYTATPIAYYEGEYPGSALATSFRMSFKVKLQTLPELNFYPLVGVVEVITAWETHFEKTKQTKFRLQNVELNTYPETPTGYYSGYYPGSKAVETIRTSFKVKRQLLPQLDSFPSALALVDAGAFVVPPAFRTSFKVRLQEVIGVERFPAAIPPVVFSFGVPSRIDPNGQGVEGLFS